MLSFWKASCKSVASLWTEEQFEDFKGVNGRRRDNIKMSKRTNNGLQNITQKTKHRASPQKEGVSSSAPEGKAVCDLRVAHGVLIFLQTR